VAVCQRIAGAAIVLWASHTLPFIASICGGGLRGIGLYVLEATELSLQTAVLLATCARSIAACTR